MKLFNKEVTREEILDRIGDLSQLGGIKSYELNDGSARGIRAYDIKTPAGIDMTVLADRGMEISYLAYKSIPISWRSAVKESHSAYFESKWDEWLRNYYGGLLTMCGFTYCGNPCVYEGIEYNIHGRASNLPAYNLSYDVDWQDESCSLWVKGKVKEAKHGGDKIELNRKITTYLESPKIIIEDKIKNIGFKTSTLMLLYHFNIGWPIIDTTSKLIEGKANVKPNDIASEKAFSSYSSFAAPSMEAQDNVFIHDIDADHEGFSNIAIINEAFDNNKGIGIWLRFKKDNLPYLTQWKLLRAKGEYVCGIEPGNLPLTSFKEAKENGEMKYIEPGEEKNILLEFNVLESKDAIENLKDKLLQ